jgi:hypothetical protein
MIRLFLMTTLVLLGCGVNSEARATAIRAGLSTPAGGRCFTCKAACLRAKQRMVQELGVAPDEVSCESPRIVNAGDLVAPCRAALWDEHGVTLTN